MSEMVERVARAIRSGRGCEGEVPCPFCLWGPDERTAEHDETGCIWLVRTAFEAAREPTADMIAEANRLNHPRDAEVWRAMIDAALR